jgi:hypothetical protein
MPVQELAEDHRSQADSHFYQHAIDEYSISSDDHSNWNPQQPFSSVAG